MSSVINDIIELTNDLVRFQTTSKNYFELHKCADFIVAYFEDCKTYTKIVERDRIPSIIITTKNTKCPAVLLHGHFDVADTTSEDGFRPHLEGFRLWGRGACDMKSGVAIMMYAMRRIIKENPHIDIGFMLHGDEENGSENGARHVVEDLGYNTKLLINFDGGLNETISHAEKGIVRLRISSRVDSPYTLYNPWNGKSAVDEIYQVLEKLKKLFPGNTKATETDNWHTTYAVRSIRTHQEVPSEVPKEALLELTIYFVEDKNTDACIEFLRQEFPWVKIEPTLQIERVYVSKDDPQLKKWQEIMSQEFKKEIPIRAENGSSDARFFSHLKIPMIIVTPTGAGFHTNNEYVDIHCFEPYVRTLERFLR